MTILTEGSRKADFIVSESNDWRSRDVGLVTVPANTTFESGTVLGQVTIGSKFVRHDTDGLDDGRRTVAALLFEPLVNTTAAPVDFKVALVVRDAEVAASEMTYEEGADASAIAASNAALASLGLIVR